MNLRRRVQFGLVWSAAEKGGNQLLTFLTFIILVRLLEPASFGLLAAAVSVTSLFALFANHGFTSAIVQREHLHSEHLDSAFWLGLTAHGMIAAAVWWGAPVIASLFRMPELEPVVRWMTLSLMFMGLSQVPLGMLRREMAFRGLAARQLLGAGAGGAVGIVMALDGYGVWSLVCRQLVTALVSTVLLWSLVKWRPRWGFSWSRARELLSFGLNVTGTNIARFLSRRSDEVLVGALLGPIALGYYHVGFRLVRLMTQLLGRTVDNVAWPAFSRLQSQPERLREGFYRASALIALVAFPAAAGVCAISPEIVSVLFGGKWQPSEPVMEVLAFLGLFQALMVIQESVINSMGKPHWVFAMRSVMGIGCVAAFFAVWTGGIVAIALAYVLVSYLFLPVSVTMVARLTGASPWTYAKRIAGPMAAAATMYTAIEALKLWTSGWAPALELGGLVVAGVLVYWTALKFLAPTLYGYAREMLIGLFKEGRGGKLEQPLVE